MVKFVVLNNDDIDRIYLEKSSEYLSKEFLMNEPFICHTSIPQKLEVEKEEGEEKSKKDWF